MQHALRSDSELDDSPINPDWIIAGEPVAKCSQWGSSGDGSTGTYVWSCTAGEFDWHFEVDEIIHVVEGEVVVTSPDGITVTLGVGDSGFFPAGTVWRWRVPVYVRKHATLVTPMPVPVRAALRLARKGKHAVEGALGRRPQRATAEFVAQEPADTQRVPA